MEQLNNIKKQNKLEKILDDMAQKAAEITFLKDESLRELAGKTDEESKAKFREKTKELWKEFAVHGILRFNGKERKNELLSFSDLDGKTSVGLFKMSGFDASNLKYVEPGEFVPGAINLDTGRRTGVVISPEDKTVWVDHHGKEADKATLPASRRAYLLLVGGGFLKKNNVLDKLTQFVSRVDRGAYPNKEKLFWKSDRTVLGLQRFFTFENLYDYFSQNRSPEEELTDKDLEKYNLVKRGKEQKAIIENTKTTIEDLEKGGFIIETKFGKVAVDIGKKLKSGYDGARASGIDGYLIFNPQTQSFFISIYNVDLTALGLSEGVCVRKNMWIKQQDEKPLNISLREIINKLGGKIENGTQFRRALETLDLMSKEFTVIPKESADKKGNKNYITTELGKMAVFPRDFKPEPGKKYIVKIKSDSAPGEKRGVYYLEAVKMKENDHPEY